MKIMTSNNEYFLSPYFESKNDRVLFINWWEKSYRGYFINPCRFNNTKIIKTKKATEIKQNQNKK